MGEDARIAFYRVVNCGYYESGKAEPAFGHLTDILFELEAWTAGKPLGETCPCPTQASEAVHPAYCLDLTREESANSGSASWLLTTWNEVPSNGTGIASVDSLSLVGAASVTTTNIPKNAIPGYATYFWLIPSSHLLATITFPKQRANGHAGLHKFMNEFMAQFTKYVVVKENADDENIDQQILGYCASGGTPQDMVPRFKAQLWRSPAKIDVLRARRADITKVVRKNLLAVKAPQERALWNKLLVATGLLHPRRGPDSVKIRYEVEYKPTQEELEEIITHWEEDDSDIAWDDVGFHLRGEPAPIWLSHSFAKESIELEVERRNEHVVQARSLLKSLVGQRDSLLRMLNTR